MSTTNQRMSSKMNNSMNAKIILWSTLGSLVLLNVLSNDHFARLDLTHDQVYTLSAATQDTMRELEDVVSVTAYITEDMPVELLPQVNYVKDMLAEYHAASGGMFAYEFIDPMKLETDEDKQKRMNVQRDFLGNEIREKTSVEIELEGLGIAPLNVGIRKGAKEEKREVYFSFLVRYQESTEVMANLPGPGAFEYDFTSVIQRLTRARTPVLGVAQDKGALSLEEGMPQIKAALDKNYDVRAVNLEDDGALDDVDALLVVGNSEAYSEKALKAVDAFLMEGKSAAFLLDTITIDPRGFQPKNIENGFDDLLKAYGIELGGQLVADRDCGSLPMQERRGRMMIQTRVPYPLSPEVQVLEGTGPLVRGVTKLPLMLAAPLYLNDKIDDVTVTALAKSSDYSWLEERGADKIDPRREWRAEDIVTTGPYPLVATAEGLLPSAYGEGKAKDKARVFVAGTSRMANETYFFLGTSGALLLFNVVDWMLADPALLEMRTRGITIAPINPALKDGARSAVKFGNVVGAPLLLVLYGVIRRSRRNRRRAALMGK
jgi:ABC-type uncharacterized transport system involved in gliding motility auxiliary subunit